MFSVIIPLYNKADHIRKAVHSVLHQTFTDFELIVVNDGSTDGGLDRIKCLKDERIKIFSQQNAGVSAARNNGVKEATHDYIAFLDADDWWDARYLNEMNNLINNFPEAGLYGAKYREVKNGRQREAIIRLDHTFKEGYIHYFEAYAKTNWMPLFPSSAVMPKRVFDEMGGFKPLLKLGEDFDLWVRVALKYKVAYLNKPLVYYNQDVDMSHKGVNPKKIYEIQTHYIFQLNYLKEEEKKNASLKKLLDQKRVYALFRYYLSGSNKKETREQLNKVNFSKQSLAVKLKYKLPLPIVKFYHYCRLQAHQIKQFIK